MRKLQLLLCVLSLLFVHASCVAQFVNDSGNNISSLNANQYISAVTSKAGKYSTALDKQTENYVVRLSKQEARLRKKLAGIDSSAAKRLFDGAPQQYQGLQNHLKNKSENLLKKGSPYLPWLDSASTSLHFLHDKIPIASKLQGEQSKITAALSQIKELETQLKKAATVKEFIQQRKEYLKEQLQAYHLGSELKKYNKTAYYYSQQINEYREALADSKKAERKALDLLNRLPAFASFMRKNSMLAGMFRISPEDPNDQAYLQSLTGLQTRDQVKGLLESELGVSGIAGMKNMQGSIMDAKSPFSQLKDRIAKYGQAGSEVEAPDFKVNNQKTKSLWNRLEYGTNIQSTRGSNYFPVTTDWALSAGYKINSKSTAGLGISYKMGWGKDIRHISITNQGLGLRSFLDIKVKDNFFVSGGFEYNYQKVFYSVRELYTINSWQKSGLIGVSKTMPLRKGLFTKTKLQLLWDMLSYQQIPRTQAFKFRVGYSF